MIPDYKEYIDLSKSAMVVKIDIKLLQTTAPFASKLSDDFFAHQASMPGIQ
jgi:hypothetical protein